jgi:hypothetical protein
MDAILGHFDGGCNLYIQYISSVTVKRFNYKRSNHTKELDGQKK